MSRVVGMAADWPEILATPAPNSQPFSSLTPSPNRNGTKINQCKEQHNSQCRQMPILHSKSPDKKSPEKSPKKQSWKLLGCPFEPNFLCHTHF